MIYYFDNVTAISIGQETFAVDRTMLGKFITIIKTNFIYMQGWVQTHVGIKYKYISAKYNSNTLLFHVSVQIQLQI